MRISDWSSDVCSSDLGNIDGMGNERLYQKARFGTKRLIEDYVAQVVAALDSIAASRAIPRDENRDFFRRALHCYGRSALLLSGSASFLFFHIGVVEEMWNEGWRQIGREHV